MLFDPLRIGPYVLRNRVFMAPLTRARAAADGTPTQLMATYYAQRASAGLIVAEATAVSAQAMGGSPAPPGLFLPEHVEAWRRVTDAVHGRGGTIFLQIWHTGRLSHPDFVGGAQPVAPSAIAAEGARARTPRGAKPFVVPRALAAGELPAIASDFAATARRAMHAGFDGVEIHAGNGYLLDQFIRDGSNRRADAFGGSIEGRWRFPLQVVDAVTDAIGAERTGVRVSPITSYSGMRDSDPKATFVYGARELDRRDVAYLHVIEGPGAAYHFADELLHPHLRAAFDGVLILNGGYDAESGARALAAGAADAIAYGKPFVANPDLPLRFRAGAELNAPDPATFYTPGPRGYTDYPCLDVAECAPAASF